MYPVAMIRRQRKEKETFMGRTSDAKEKLVDVAFELIWDNSYGSVSVDQICERADVNKGSFYYYFKTKSDLAVAAYEEHWKRKQPELDRIFSPQSPPLERISNWCGHVYRGQKAQAEKYGHVCGCPYASVGAEIATQDNKIRQKVEELIARSTKYVESALGDAIHEGQVSIINPKTAARQVYSYLLGVVLQAKIQNDVEVLQDIEPTIMRIVGAQTEALAVK